MSNRFTGDVTKTQICNLALSKLGSDRLQLSSFASDTGQIKEQCDLFFLPTLEELTHMYSWNCCTKRATASADGAFAGEYGYSNSYDLPADCIRVLGIERDATDEMSTAGVGSVALEQNEFIIVGRKLFCNIASTVYIQYTAIPEDTASSNDYEMMDASFLKCFYTLLAVKLAVPLTGNAEIENAIRSEFNNIVLPEAKRLNSIEGDNSVYVDEEYNELPVGAFNHAQFRRV